MFRQPEGGELSTAAIIYGIGLALTFDEFGMWLHLGGGYWQRASFDAIITIAAVLGLIAAAPRLRRFGPWQWVTAIALLIVVTVFLVLLARSVQARWHIGPSLQQLEEQGPQ